MECPVCKTTINGDHQKKCPECATDPELFILLEIIEKQALRQKRIFWLLLALLILTICAAVASYFYFIDQHANQLKNDSETISRQYAEIQNLKDENKLLLDGIAELRIEVQTLTEKFEQKNLKDTLTAKASKPAFTEIIHVVKPGENLKKIARKYYGNSEEYLRIMKDNNIKDANNIIINQKLKILIPVSE